jgi:hypothetical protein
MSVLSFPGGADPLVRSRRPRRLARVSGERVLGDPRGPGGPPHSLTKSEETTRWNKAKMM